MIPSTLGILRELSFDPYFEFAEEMKYAPPLSASLPTDVALANKKCPYV
jgi:hypothetical protein